MAHNDFVSVTIVTYNSGRFIKRCLESVLAQKYPLKEIIVVDNASTDGTIDILEQFEDRCQHLLQRREHRLRRGAEPGHQALQRRLGADPESRRAAAAQFHSGAGGRRPVRFPHRHGVRQAAHHDVAFRDPRKAGGGFHRHLLQPHAAPPGPRQPGSGQRPLPAIRIRIRRHCRRGPLPPRHDRGHFARRRVLRLRFLRLPRGRRCRLAGAVDGLEVPLRALRPRLSRAQGSARQPPRPAARNQHALGEEPLPDAHQEHLAGSLPAQLVFHHRARCHGGDVLPAVGAQLAEGVLVPGAELEAGHGQAPSDSEPRAAWTTTTWRAGSSTRR